MSWSFARCTCGDVMERHAGDWLHMGVVGSRGMLETGSGDLQHEPIYELVERRIYVRPDHE